jgi:hypothetical protein
MPKKNEQLEPSVQRALMVLRSLAPPKGMTDEKAIKAYYRIFNSPPTWKPSAKGSAKQGRDETEFPKVRQLESSRTAKVARSLAR